MDDAFSEDYATARRRFTEATEQAGGTLRSFVLEGFRGPRDEILATDVAWIGASRPNAALIVTSGTHGVEGYAGSALQITIAQSLQAPGDPAVMLVHALNPYGFAHTRRVNEDNIDLNRNFIDFAEPPTAGAGYSKLHAALVPEDWDGAKRRAADAALTAMVEKLSARQFQEAVCEGQYEFADGLFYGGRKAAWSNRTWRSILAQLPASVSCVGHIDIHTGLGPLGYGEILWTLPEVGAAYELARRWYGDLDLRMRASGTSAATDVVGTMNRAVLALLPRRRVCSVTLEFGTVEFGRMLAAVRADNWLHLRGDTAAPLGSAIKRELRECFDPQDSMWRGAVIRRGLQVFERTRVELGR